VAGINRVRPRCRQADAREIEISVGHRISEHKLAVYRRSHPADISRNYCAFEIEGKGAAAGQRLAIKDNAPTDFSRTQVNTSIDSALTLKDEIPPDSQSRGIDNAARQRIRWEVVVPTLGRMARGSQSRVTDHDTPRD